MAGQPERTFIDATLVEINKGGDARQSAAHELAAEIEGDDFDNEELFRALSNRNATSLFLGIIGSESNSDTKLDLIFIVWRLARHSDIEKERAIACNGVAVVVKEGNSSTNSYYSALCARAITGIALYNQVREKKAVSSGAVAMSLNVLSNDNFKFDH
ncbi:MAG: hypothetical protein AAF787_14175, partial [Chloroflexota bacterium]